MENRSYSGKQVRDATLLLLTGFALYLCWLLAKPFLAAITWALALAVVAHPLQSRLERRLRPNLAALLAVLALVVLLLVPGAFFAQSLFEEASGGLERIGKNLNSTGLREAADRYPFLAQAVHWLESRFDLNEELKRAAGTLAGRASSVVGGSIRFVTQMAIMLVTLFYFLRDRGRLLQLLGLLIPLSRSETDELFGRVSETISATLYGNLVVKLVQGILGGVMFWILGLPAPILCGIAMALLAIVPVVGASLIWGPAAIILLMQGSWVKAIVLTVWGGLVVSLMDNFLYPMLVAGELRFHTLGVLFSVFGGLIVFGLAGIVLGPVILVSTVALLEVWRLRAANEKD
ncbi:MAG: AI-2E family transporter [Acidobacteriia bacterium]|nr:AI-2E family transporter [Terriglobia bacterium]